MNNKNKSKNTINSITKKDKLRAMMKTAWDMIIKPLLFCLLLIAISVLLVFLLKYMAIHHISVVKIIGYCICGLLVIAFGFTLVGGLIYYIKDGVIEDYRCNLNEIKDEHEHEYEHAHAHENKNENE